MIVGGHVSCGYCSAVIAELEPWPAGERREFVCPECGCVNYATPVVEYRSTTFGRELWRAIVAKVSRRGGTAEFYDDDAASIRLDGTTACTSASGANRCRWTNMSEWSQTRPPGSSLTASRSWVMPRSKRRDGEIRLLPPNEFYQSPFDGRWVELDPKEIEHLIELQIHPDHRDA